MHEVKLNKTPRWFFLALVVLVVAGLARHFGPDTNSNKWLWPVKAKVCTCVTPYFNTKLRVDRGMGYGLEIDGPVQSDTFAGIVTFRLRGEVVGSMSFSSKGKQNLDRTTWELDDTFQGPRAPRHDFLKGPNVYDVSVHLVKMPPSPSVLYLGYYGIGTFWQFLRVGKLI